MSTRARSEPAACKPARSRGPVAHVGLLRGINVGGRNKLPMGGLVEVFARAGAADVRTYIQSGNVVFRATVGAAAGIARGVSRGIRERFGIDVPVVVRTADELRRVAERNPFLPAGADAATLHVALLADEPVAGRVAQLDANRSPGDAFQALGREVYLHLPNGVARSKLTNNYFDSVLGTVSTIRNWRTVLKLVELAEAPG